MPTSHVPVQGATTHFWGYPDPRMSPTRPSACHHQGVEEIEIRGEMIRLGQLLKLSNLAGSGADARDLLLESGVTVNGEIETRRGRQLHRGDVVAIGDEALRVT